MNSDGEERESKALGGKAGGKKGGSVADKRTVVLCRQVTK